MIFIPLPRPEAPPLPPSHHAAASRPEPEPQSQPTTRRPSTRHANSVASSSASASSSPSSSASTASSSSSTSTAPSSLPSTPPPDLVIPAFATTSPSPQRDLARVWEAVSDSRRIVVVCGAGISVSPPANIPDFRSDAGLFKTLKEQHPDAGLSSGKDLFDARLFQSESNTALFYSMIASLHSMTLNAQPTLFHHLLRRLDYQGRLQRVYTQNIDALEQRAGLSFGLGQGAGRTINFKRTLSLGKRKRGHNSNDSASNEHTHAHAHAHAQPPTRRPAWSKAQSAPAASLPQGPRAAGARLGNPEPQPTDPMFPRVIPLHGSLSSLVCTVCDFKMATLPTSTGGSGGDGDDQHDGQTTAATRAAAAAAAAAAAPPSPDVASAMSSLAAGEAPVCPACAERDSVRVTAGLRSRGIGFLKPDVVLYNGANQNAERVGECLERDVLGLRDPMDGRVPETFTEENLRRKREEKRRGAASKGGVAVKEEHGAAKEERVADVSAEDERQVEMEMTLDASFDQSMDVDGDVDADAQRSSDVLGKVFEEEEEEEEEQGEGGQQPARSQHTPSTAPTAPTAPPPCRAGRSTFHRSATQPAPRATRPAPAPRPPKLKPLPPDLLIVAGTSLKVPGTKRVVREFAKAARARDGIVPAGCKSRRNGKAGGSSRENSKTPSAAGTSRSSTRSRSEEHEGSSAEDDGGDDDSDAKAGDSDDYGPMARAEDGSNPHRPIRVVLLNYDFPVPAKEWEDVFDVWVQGDVQACAGGLWRAGEGYGMGRGLYEVSDEEEGEEGETQDGEEEDGEDDDGDGDEDGEAGDDDGDGDEDGEAGDDDDDEDIPGVAPWDSGMDELDRARDDVDPSTGKQRSRVGRVPGRRSRDKVEDDDDDDDDDVGSAPPTPRAKAKGKGQDKGMAESAGTRTRTGTITRKKSGSGFDFQRRLTLRGDGDGEGEGGEESKAARPFSSAPAPARARARTVSLLSTSPHALLRRLEGFLRASTAAAAADDDVLLLFAVDKTLPRDVLSAAMRLLREGEYGSSPHVGVLSHPVPAAALLGRPTARVHAHAHAPHHHCISVSLLPRSIASPFYSTIPGSAPIRAGRWATGKPTFDGSRGGSGTPADSDDFFDWRQVWGRENVPCALPPEFAGLEQREHALTLLLGSDAAPQGLLEGLEARYAESPLLGSLASNTVFETGGREATLFHRAGQGANASAGDARIYDKGALGVFFRRGARAPAERPSVGVDVPWYRFVSLGPRREVTRAKGNIVSELQGGNACQHFLRDVAARGKNGGGSATADDDDAQPLSLEAKARGMTPEEQRLLSKGVKKEEDFWAVLWEGSPGDGEGGRADATTATRQPLLVARILSGHPSRGTISLDTDLELALGPSSSRAAAEEAAQRREEEELAALARSLGRAAPEARAGAQTRERDGTPPRPRPRPRPKLFLEFVQNLPEDEAALRRVALGEAGLALDLGVARGDPTELEQEQEGEGEGQTPRFVFLNAEEGGRGAGAGRPSQETETGADTAADAETDTAHVHVHVHALPGVFLLCSEKGILAREGGAGARGRSSGRGRASVNGRQYAREQEEEQEASDERKPRPESEGEPALRAIIGGEVASDSDSDSDSAGQDARQGQRQSHTRSRGRARSRAQVQAEEQEQEQEQHGGSQGEGEGEDTGDTGVVAGIKRRARAWKMGGAAGWVEVDVDVDLARGEGGGKGGK